jgi:hypothetical protein
MAKRVEIVLNSDGVKALLKSDEMMAICEEKANSALQRLGNGYEVTKHVGPGRVNASISAVTAAARREVHKSNSILKALGGSK